MTAWLAVGRPGAGRARTGQAAFSAPAFSRLPALAREGGVVPDDF